jgi:hypothetical protein
VQRHRTTQPTVRHRRSAAMALPPLAALLLTACSAPPAETVTLYVSTGGDDNSGSGTAGAPYRTVTAAVNAAPAGSSIRIADGVYAAAAGEAFPLDVSGLTLRGQSAAATILSGSSAALYGLTMAGGETTVSDLTIKGFGTDATGANVWIGGGTVILEDVITSGGARYGLQAIGGIVTLRSVTVSGNDDDNVFVRGSAELEVFDSLVSGSITADGIDVGDSARLRVRTTQVVGNDGSGIELGESSRADLGTAADPGGNAITGNAIGGGNAVQLEDGRNSGAALISAVGNDFGAAVSGIQTGPAISAPVWRIDSTGNQIDFGP